MVTVDSCSVKSFIPTHVTVRRQNTANTMTYGRSTVVQKFYHGCGVFVTGGTGFLGKLTVEKILRSCPDVRKVYVLIRPKKHFSIEERKNALLNNVVFDRLKNERPGSLEKVVFLSGDCSAPRLGLGDSDYFELTQHVNIVLHLAATVRFDEKMKVAINVNIKGTMETIKLCRECLHLKAGVFVTTAYSNCYERVVKEEFYEPPMKFEELLALMDKFTEKELEIMSHKIIGQWRIPYLFSKAMVENLILTHAKDLPVAIVRPSMVVSTVKEPVPGWLDNMYGPTSLIIGVGTGVLRVISFDMDLIVDLVPADIVINCIIAVPSTLDMRSNDGITIYNTGTSEKNPTTVGLLSKTMFKVIEEFPLKTVIWYPFMIAVPNIKLYTFLTLLLHILPGCVLDFAIKLKGKSPRLLKLYMKIRKYSLIMNSIPNTEPIIVSDNTVNVYEKLGSEDKQLFFFDARQINWEKFFQTACLESRKYLLADTLDNWDNARAHIRKLYIAHVVVKYLLYGVAIWTAWRILAPFLHNVI